MNTLIAVAACCVLFFGGLVCAQSADTQPQGDQPQDKPIKVMSFNIRWGGAADPPSVWSKRHERVLQTIKAYDPDILGVQEAVLFQAKELRDVLDTHIFFGAGRDNGKLGGEMCAIYYRRDRFRRIGGGHFWLSEEPDTPGSYGWGSSFPRMVSWLRLRDKQSGRALMIANTHFDHRSDEARLNSALLMRKKIPVLMEGQPVIILGDFNCTEDSKPYAELMKIDDEQQTPWLIDAYRAVHQERSEEEATYHGFRGKREGSRIDWVLHSPGFVTLNATIDTTHEGLKYPSDHFPVTAEVRWAD